ncbi:hypothetical protein Tco_0111090 [Tanacetum coccineum]
MTKTKSFNKNTKHKALYHALMESILEDEDAMDKGVADKSKKRNPDDADRDEGPLAKSNQGLKRKKMSKYAKPSTKAKSTETSKGTTKSQPKSTGKSAQADETVFEAGDAQIILVDYFFNNDLAYLQEGSIGRTYTNSLTKTEAAKYDLQGIENMVPNLVSKHDVYSTKRILAVKNVKVNIWYGYCRLEEIEVRRSDQQLYKFMEGDFPRLHLNDIEDMLLLVKHVEDLQLGVEIYQKKLNISRPLVHKASISDLAPYMAYSNPQSFICLDKLERNKLMYSHELYKFNDGTLILSNLDKKWSRIMVKDIDCQLLERRLTRSLEKFVGGREYGEDLRLLLRTI